MSSPSTREGPMGAFRPLSEAERNILTVLLGAEFPGNIALAEQMAHATARQIDPEGSLEFSVAGGPPAEVVRRVPVEAELEDSDGVTIHVLLHVLDGFMNELEILREDSGPIRRLPSPGDLRVLVL